MNNLAKILRKKRVQAGSINFQTPEVKFELDEKGSPISIAVKKITESNNLIEEFMLLANRLIAEFFGKFENNSEVPFVYRVHDLPDREKVLEFASFVKSLGYNFNPDTAAKSTEFQRLLESAEGSDEEAVISEIAIRSMAKAVYDIDNIGHYGLGFDYYTHFTSPIRRFPDLIVHKILFRYLDTGGVLFNRKRLRNIADHSSFQERNAVNAERQSVKIKQAEYLSSKLGDEFNGVISGVNNFGLFVELSETLAEGLVRIRDLEDDFYIYDEKNYALIGKYKAKKYRIGDKVKVQLIRVDKNKREIDFLLL
jgi:ribonuclease R